MPQSSCGGKIVPERHLRFTPILSETQCLGVSCDVNLSILQWYLATILGELERRGPIHVKGHIKTFQKMIWPVSTIYQIRQWRKYYRMFTDIFAPKTYGSYCYFLSQHGREKWVGGNPRKYLGACFFHPREMLFCYREGTTKMTLLFI